jgi:hypothetical protein
MLRSSEITDKTSLLPIYDEFIDVIVQGNPEAIIAFRPSEATQDRAYELIDKERDGVITPEETIELNRYMDMEHFLRMAAIRARKVIQDRAARITHDGAS